jgi:hypothetical protein
MTLRPGIPTVGAAEAPQARVARALPGDHLADAGTMVRLARPRVVPSTPERSRR